MPPAHTSCLKRQDYAWLSLHFKLQRTPPSYQTKISQCFRFLSGGTVKKRKETIERFVNSDSCHVFLLNKACGAVGINLTMATHVMILEPSWNPLWEEQAISRAHRLGQSGPIKVLRFSCDGAPIHLPA